MSPYAVTLVVGFAALAALSPGFSVAAEEAPQASTGSTMPSPVAPGLDACARDDSARLSFLSERLEGRRRYATNYMRGWLAFYTVGFGVSTYSAATRDDSAEAAVQALSAAKSVFGIGRMLYDPPYARLGMDGIIEGSPGTAEACSADVAEAEERLKNAAHQAGRRFRWKSHVFNLALHSIGAVAVGEGFGAREDAWASAGVGAVVGEIVIWTFPWHAESDYAEYQEKFPRSGVAASPRLAWSIVPTSAGAALQLRF
jgi:hypothetical protein